MYLSKLEVHGFKSFAQRTALAFDPGVTAIVGPNGCGKSNIVDAVRWVIGEQRSRILRSDKMESVIFNGTSKRRPLGMAEVMLTIENTRGVLPTEYTEVTLGRRLFRSGESEYLLNGIKCRLQDITDLFMDTGMGAGAYSVIELKMIEEILSENAQDRRRLFEEAAGITKYKLRRRQALSKLDGTQADLTRLRDLTEEIAKQVRSLKRQADKAEKHKAYADRLHHLELTLAQAEYLRLQETRAALQQDLDRLQAEAEALATAETDAEAHLAALRDDLDACAAALEDRRRTLTAHQERMRGLEADLRLQDERLAGARRDRDRLLREGREADARADALERTVARLTTEMAEAAPRLAEATRELETLEAARDRTRQAAEEARRHLQGLRAREQEADEARATHRRDLDRLTSRLELLEQDRARGVQTAEHLSVQAAELDARARHAAASLEDARAEAEAARAGLDEARRQRQQGQARLEEAQEALRAVERSREAAAAEAVLLESLVSSYEEFSGAVQFLAAEPDWTPNALQTVADVLACDEKDRLALDAALGAYAACIVVRTDAEAQAAMVRLRDAQQGRATFIVLDRLRLPATAATPPAAQPLLDRVRTADPAFVPLAQGLIGDVYVTETLDDGRALAAEAAPGMRFVTRAGEWVEGRGLLHGGSRDAAASPAAGRLGRREQYENVSRHLAALEAALADRKQEVGARRQELEALPFEARRTALAQAEHALAAREKEHTRVGYEREHFDRQGSELQKRLERLANELETGQAEVARLRTAAEQAEGQLAEARRARAAAEEAFQTAEAESRAALHRFSDASVAAVQVRNRHDNLRRDLERARHGLKDLHARADARTGDLAALETRIAQGETAGARLQETQRTLEADRPAMAAAVTDAEAGLAAAKASAADVEAQLRRQRLAREQQMREEHQRAVRLAEVQTRTADLLDHIREDFGRSLAEEPLPLDDDFAEEAARAEVQDLRKRIGGLGAVNALALETYREEQERLTFLQGQQQDLEAAEATLLSTIDEINTTAAQRFQETYDAIRLHFTRLFRNLFGEDAHADLELIDPTDPLESAIEIMAKPRGKRPSTIAQLSGGEKTLTAIALLFAIYLVKPSPFCILDEVDAPLDEANVERFMQLIRAFADSTQFILVTHNKRTMELADRMYGITMQEQGVSKLVGVQFDEVPAVAE